MTKLTTVLVLFLLCAPALADTRPEPLQLAFSIADGKTTRVHTLYVIASCASVSESADEHVDEIKACSEPVGDRTELRVDWKTSRDLDGGKRHSSYAGSARVVVAKGTAIALGGNADARLSLAIR